MVRYFGVARDGSIVAPPEVWAALATYISKKARDDERANGSRSEALRQFVESANLSSTIALTKPIPTPEPKSTAPIKLITTAEAATRMGCSGSYVRRLARTGRIAARRVGLAWLIDADDIDTEAPRRAA